jgi:hypothetical protein
VPCDFIAFCRPHHRLLIICHDKAGLRRGDDERRLVDVFLQALELSTRTQARIWLTTVQRLRERQHDPSPLAAPLWLRVRDFRPLLHDYRRYVASLNTGRGHKPMHRKRQFVAEHVASLSPHPLLPTSTGA